MRVSNFKLNYAVGREVEARLVHVQPPRVNAYNVLTR